MVPLPGLSLGTPLPFSAKEMADIERAWAAQGAAGDVSLPFHVSAFMQGHSLGTTIAVSLDDVYVLSVTPVMVNSRWAADGRPILFGIHL